jgi:hypothetical protein
MSGARPCRYIQPIETAFTAATLWSAGPGPTTAPGRRWESGQDWDAQYRPGIPGSFQVLQKELHCDPIRAADEGDGHDHQQHGEVSDSRRLPGDNRERPQAPAQTAARTVVVKHPPVVSQGDVSESWSARQNVIESKQYERLLEKNHAFRQARMRRECGPITDPELRQSCLRSFNRD